VGFIWLKRAYENEADLLKKTAGLEVGGVENALTYGSELYCRAKEG
jgi:hypothetical protein